MRSWQSICVSFLAFAVSLVSAQPPPVSLASIPSTQSATGIVAFSYNRGFVNNANGNVRYISFQNEIANVNSDFRREFGTFVCQQPGIYFFTFSALSNALDDFRIALKKNFDTLATAYASKLDYTMSSQTAIAVLKRGDVVYLQVEEGNIFESSVQSRAYASFSGYLIQAGEVISRNGGTSNIQAFNGNPVNFGNGGNVITFDNDGITLQSDLWKLLGIVPSNTAKK